MIHFRLFNWLFVARVHRIHTVTREDLDQAGVVVCGDVEASMLAESEREMHEFEVMHALYEQVRENVDARIDDVCLLMQQPSRNPRECRRAAGKRTREFLRDLRDTVWLMDVAPAPAAEAQAGQE